MTTRGIPYDQLSASDRELVRRGQMQPGETDDDNLLSRVFPEPLARHELTDRKAKPKRDEAAIGRKRRTTGANFEAELDVTHERWKFLRWGHIRRNHAQTRVVRGKGGAPRRVLAGAADVDRSGWVAARKLHQTAVLSPCRWDADGARRFPVAFDAKVQGSSSALYVHDVELQHQLHSLRDAALAGEFAFLLVQVPVFYDATWIPGGATPGGRVFLLPILDHFTTLLAGHGVRLYRREGGRGTGSPRSFVPLAPCVEWSSESLGWDWIPLLHHADPSPRSG
jgi:hypothetical protein